MSASPETNSNVLRLEQALTQSYQRRNNIVWAARNGIAPDESYTKDEVALWEYVRRTTKTL